MSQSPDLESKRRTRWYLGSLASVWAAWCTHPMELIKVQMQTSNQAQKTSNDQGDYKILCEQGIHGFYNELTASTLLRLTNSGSRVGIYETGKNHLDTNSLSRKFLLPTFAGLVSAAVRNSHWECPLIKSIYECKMMLNYV